MLHCRHLGQAIVAIFFVSQLPFVAASEHHHPLTADCFAGQIERGTGPDECVSVLFPFSKFPHAAGNVHQVC